MKNLKVKLAMLAVALGMGAAVSTTAHAKFTNKKWGLNQTTGLYIDVTGESAPGDYRCNSSANTCTAEFPADVDPNNQAGDSHPGTVQPTNIVLGDFRQ